MTPYVVKMALKLMSRTIPWAQCQVHPTGRKLAQAVSRGWVEEDL